MLTVPELTPQVLYIEPVVHPEYLCRAVHTDGVIYCRQTSERWIDDTLIYFYSSSIKVRRQNVKLIHNIHKLQPIIIDEKYQFVLFPLESCKYKNPFFVNLRQLIDFKLVNGKLVIIFIDGREVETDFDFNFSKKQYEKTLFILDRTVKHQNALRKYYRDREG
ncbi:ComK protein [Jeotgalicoccus saudimassiliensis]|uniref:ComK protein n=1 Tax=Jeotgalicoccus saudimassiliensis TaxID=1461582 RepID=A0A078LYV1_9STAP|nr:competence protein ComK [Jeotgalicoccus saudimassiliensis]CDZ99224.1 ComK protein [Jeotgalicoccus saudimassiliensis]